MLKLSIFLLIIVFSIPSSASGIQDKFEEMEKRIKKCIAGCFLTQAKQLLTKVKKKKKRGAASSSSGADAPDTSSSSSSSSGSTLTRKEQRRLRLKAAKEAAFQCVAECFESEIEGLVPGINWSGPSSSSSSSSSGSTP
ncbi:MAG TPA: hypothetical protein DIV86_05950 [Alphaproteobacteria bacterium]|nr:hypothetical protein [Alphaproteobacteria bacterium]